LVGEHGADEAEPGPALVKIARDSLALNSHRMLRVR
jgi:hypothetical protein